MARIKLQARPWEWVVSGLITVAVVAVVAGLIWYQWELQPVAGPSAQPVSFQLAKGTGLPALARQLQQQHIIRNAGAFSLYVVLMGARSSLEAGSYDLNPHDSAPAIADVLSQGRISRNRLVVPEGSTVAKIRSLAAEREISTQEFDAALAANYSNDFLAGRPVGDSSLEGYLFPDSYELSHPAAARQLIQAMLDNFGQKVTAANLKSAYGAEGLSLHQAVTLASIVEREAGSAQDRPIIAQVFLKRLQMGMPLQSDVTVIYASQLTGQPFSTTLDSPYNTYAHTGLPPGPIANPGLASLQAVAHPATTDYLYFIADKHGVVHYAHTAAEHQANVQQYLAQ